MSTTAPRTEAIKENGRPVYVGGGAVDQDGSLKLYRCTTCGAEVVWATSGRTGRPYLVDVTRGYHGQRFYVKRSAHDCGARQDALAEYVAAEDARTAAAAWTDRLADAQRRHAAGEITRDELLAVIEAGA